MKHEELLKIIEDYHTNTDDNIVGVGYGYKETNGIITDEKSIIFSVKEKLPISKLASHKILPSEVKISNDEILTTDVIQEEYKLMTTVCDPAFYTWQTTPPSNRNKFRPLKGGISTTNYTRSSNYVGTLGLIAKDNDTNSIVGVSNNHVLIDDAFICSERSKIGAITNIKNNDVTQPNEPGNSSISNSIGKVKKYYPIRSDRYNYVDVALTTVKSSDINLSSSYHQEGLSTTNLPFATTSEINNLLTTNPLLYSAGRTTGAKGEGLLKLRVLSSPYVVSSIYYNKQGAGISVSYSDCIRYCVTYDTTQPITSICPYPIAGGDSGSALIADFSGTKKIIGLAFAGSSDNLKGIACRIDRIQTLMSISAWNGEAISFSNTNSTMEITVDGLSDNEYIDYIDGKRYWQSGLRNK